jgi:anti-sigma factor RsiW
MTEAAVEHARLQAWVAALADGELSADEARIVQEHLLGCARCRRELVLQKGLSRSLAKEPLREASAGLRRRIERLGAPAPQSGAWLRNRRWAASAIAALVLIGVAFGTALREWGGQSRSMAEIPLLRDALADCRRATARNFPRKADLEATGEGLGFPIHPLHRPGAELFSTWRTTLAGSPAAGLAYRWRGIVVVQYAVPAELIRQQADMGAALGRAGFYVASDHGEAVLAFLANGSGTLLMADAPVEELRRLML